MKVYNVAFEIEGPYAMFMRPDTGAAPNLHILFQPFQQLKVFLKLWQDMRLLISGQQNWKYANP